MKKLLTIVISTALCTVALSGCSTPRITSSNTAQTTQSASESQKKLVEYTGDTYKINLPKSGKTIRVDSKYNAYMSYVLDDVLREAEEKIYSQITYTSYNMAFYLEAEGNYLYLMAEAIVYIDHPEGVGGCDIDHKHVFFSEPIAYKK